MAERASYREGAGFNAMSFTIVALIAVVGGVITARLYGIDVIGEYALATATVNAVRLLSSAKERPALMRELAVLPPRAPRVTGLVAATLIFSASLTAVIGLLATVGIWFLFNGPVGEPDLFAPAAVSVLGYVRRREHGRHVPPGAQQLPGRTRAAMGPAARSDRVPRARGAVRDHRRLGVGACSGDDHRRVHRRDPSRVLGSPVHDLPTVARGVPRGDPDSAGDDPVRAEDRAWRARPTASATSPARGLSA